MTRTCLPEPGRRLRVELKAQEQGSWEVVLADAAATLAPSSGRPDATIAADPATWERIATGTDRALAAYLDGHLSVRRNLHVGVGFLGRNERLDRGGANAVSFGRHAQCACVDGRGR